MKILFIKFLIANIIQQIISIDLNQTILFQKYGYNINSIEIDLSSSSIEIIDVNTFKDMTNVVKLYLDDNKIKQLDNGLFNDLINLRELWLESNNIISIDKNIFINFNKLELVCFSNNPISIMFPNNVRQLCNTIYNSKCKIEITDKCKKNTQIEIESIYSYFIKYVYNLNLIYNIKQLLK